MIRFTRIVAISLPFVLMYTTLYPQKKWTLEECIGHALQNNIQIKREVLQSQGYKKDNIQAYTQFLPSIGASYEHLITVGKSFNTTSGQFEKNISYGSLGIGGSITLFQGLYNWNNLAKSKFDLLASLEGVEELKRNITVNITAKYLEVLYAKESYDLASQRIITAAQQQESAQQQFNVGRISNNDLLQIKAQAINEKVLLTNARNSLDMATLELAQMLELDTVAGFDISLTPIILPNDSTSSLKMGIDSYYREALSVLPSIKKAKYGIKSAQKQYWMTVGSALPTFSLSYEMSSYYLSSVEDVSYPDQVNDNIQKYLSFDLSIPIFRKLQNYTNISKAKINRLDAQFALEESEKTLLKNIQQAYADVQAQHNRYLSMVESEASYRELYEVNKSKFDLGMVNAVDLSLTRNNHIEAQGELLHAKYSYVLMLKILDFYRGIPITL